MPAQSVARTALDLIEQDSFQPGSGWTAAHEIVQNHEGVPLFDAIHALLHRIEGDTGNAAYWDRRAGTDFGGEGFDRELAHLREMAAKSL